MRHFLPTQPWVRTPSGAFVPTVGVTRLVEGVYGDTYYPRQLYNPDEIVHLNAADKLVSVVALDAAGEVIGHYALERHDLGKSRRRATPLWWWSTGIIT